MQTVIRVVGSSLYVDSSKLLFCEAYSASSPFVLRGLNKQKSKVQQYTVFLNLTMVARINWAYLN